MHFIGGLLYRICHATFVYRTQSQKGNKKRQQASELERDHSYITSAKGLGGWVWKMPAWLMLSAVFILTKEIDSDRMGEWGRKSPKTC